MTVFTSTRRCSRNPESRKPSSRPGSEIPTVLFRPPKRPCSLTLVRSVSKARPKNDHRPRAGSICVSRNGRCFLRRDYVFRCFLKSVDPSPPCTLLHRTYPREFEVKRFPIGIEDEMDK